MPEHRGIGEGAKRDRAGLRTTLLVGSILLLLAPGRAIAARDGGGLEGFPLSFDSEWIRIRISDDSLEVHGTYWLLCLGPTEEGIPLFYPFPRDSLLGGARMVSGTVRIPGSKNAVLDPEPLRYQALPGLSGVRWWTPPCSGDTLVIEGTYRQGIRAHYARYIVTTTQAWERPLRRARFEIRLPRGVTPKEFSFPFVPHEESGEVVYRYEAEAFMPDRDIIVRW